MLLAHFNASKNQIAYTSVAWNILDNYTNTYIVYISLNFDIFEVWFEFVRENLEPIISNGSGKN